MPYIYNPDGVHRIIDGLPVKDKEGNWNTDNCTLIAELKDDVVIILLGGFLTVGSGPVKIKKVE